MDPAAYLIGYEAEAEPDPSDTRADPDLGVHESWSRPDQPRSSESRVGLTTPEGGPESVGLLVREVLDEEVLE